MGTVLSLSVYPMPCQCPGSSQFALSDGQHGQERGWKLSTAKGVLVGAMERQVAAVLEPTAKLSPLCMFPSTAPLVFLSTDVGQVSGQPEHTDRALPWWVWSLFSCWLCPKKMSPALLCPCLLLCGYIY